MNRTIRGMAGLLVALGASACANDYSLDFGGPPTMVQASPETMFITSGAAPKELLLRLVNERNQSVPAEWTVTNVPAGLTVEKDEDYRPDWVNDNGELEPDALQVQHRYFVSADMPTGGMVTFTVASQGISEQITVRVLPTNLGAALSSTAPALGEQVTITAPANLSFTDASVVTIPGGGDAVIVSQDADVITFIPIPGSSGPVTVSGVILDYAPTLAPRTLATATNIDVPAVSSIPLAYSSTTPAAGTAVTVTATGFRFEDDVVFDFGGEEAFVLSVSADGATATILPPPNMAGVTATVSNTYLAGLQVVTLSDIPSTAAVTTSAYPTPPAGGTSLGTAITFNAAAPGTGAFWAESGVLAFGPEVNYLGGSNQGAPRYYKLIVATAGTYDINISWNGGGDMDLYLRDAADANVANSPSGANPEHVSADLTPGTYYIVLHDWRSLGPTPTEVLITVK